MSKADNMLSILWALKSGQKKTAKQLAESLEIHIRTVYRYIDALCASGVPIIADAGHNGGYSLLQPFTEAPLLFDGSEQKALVHAAIFAQEAGYPFGKDLQRAISKLKRYTNPEQLDEINRHESGLDVIHPPSDGSLDHVLQQLELASAGGETLLMSYYKGRDEAPTERLLDPYGLVHWKSRWYIVGYCHLRLEIRSFRADRIQALSGAQMKFERPDAFSARQFFLRTLLPDSNDKDNLIPVRIKGHQGAVQELSDHWLFGHLVVERSDQHICFLADERYILTYTPYILLGFGRAIQVLEPAALQERMISLASELAEFYRVSYQ